MSHDATGLAELVAAKEVTLKELLALARKRPQQVNGKAQRDRHPRRQRADAQVKGDLSGPFAGVPFLIKDLSQEYKGYPTTCGSRAPQRRRHGERPGHPTLPRRGSGGLR